jgi:hypothetical protein
MTSLNKRLAYLGIADFDYLSARVLLRHGLVFTGLPKAADAFEKIIKLNLILEAKISRNEELAPENLKKFEHRLKRLLEEFSNRTGIVVEPVVVDYFAMLQDAAARRYPEHWKTYRADASINQLDEVYCQFRNLAAANFPIEEQERARCFGTFLGDAYTETMMAAIHGLGGESPWDLLAYNTKQLDKFNLDHTRSAGRFA